MSTDCVIIGAGAAGLAAGAMFHEAGRSFVILEARDRIGGRANSIPLSGGAMAERGAQYVHGARVCTWEYITRHGLTSHFAAGPNRTSIPEYRDGEWRLDGYPDTAAALSRMAAVFDIPDAPSVSIREALERAGFTGPEMQAAESRMHILTPADLNSASASGGAKGWSLVASTTANFMLVEGYQTLWERMSAPFHAAIHFETPVTQIEWGPDGVVVSAGNERYEAATAIVTLPVGVLQSGTVRFQPALPDWKQAAIDRILSGPLLKFVAEFRRPFWEDYLGTVVNFRSSSHPFSPFGVYYWDRPGPPTLLTFLGGRDAMTLSGNPERARESFVNALSEMFSEVDVPGELRQLEIADWANDPWARGGVSVEPVNGRHLRSDLARQTAPLFWAGEATPTDNSAECVHGALATGRQAALDALHLVRPLAVGQPNARLDWSSFVD